MTPSKFSPGVFFGSLCVASFVKGYDILKPCKLNDDVCVLSSAQAAYPKLIAGVPSAGIEPGDPLHINLIDGNLVSLNYNLTDSTIEGYKDCKIEAFKIDTHKWTTKIEFVCPKYVIFGNYVISGRLIIVPVEGNGTYRIVAKKYKVVLDSEIKKSKGKDGVYHLSIQNFKVTAEARDGVVFDFKNLFNGNKDLSDAVHKFANENWKEVADFVQGPVFNAAFKKLVVNTNKYLKTIPFDGLFL